MSSFHLPDLGEGLKEAELVAWHISEGDRVVADQPLASVETDKAVVEIPSPRAGTIKSLHGKPGDLVEVGSLLVEFAEAETPDAGAVVGEIASKAEEPAPATEEPAAPRRGRASPAVRAKAEELGVDLATIEGTGPCGTITRADVEKAAAPGGAPREPEPLRGVRRAMARNMERSHAEIVPATVQDEADLGGWKGRQDVTIRLIRAIAAACRAEPALNAHFFGADRGRVLHETVELGIAMDTGEGLFVPVMRDVGNRDAEDLRRGLEAMKADVKARTVPLEELRGQTITLSNFGMFGGRHVAMVILPPQVAIIGAGRLDDRVIAVGGKPAVRPVLPLSLTFDHRAVAGGEAARFLAALIADLEKPQ